MNLDPNRMDMLIALPSMIRHLGWFTLAKQHSRQPHLNTTDLKKTTFEPEKPPAELRWCSFNLPGWAVVCGLKAASYVIRSDPRAWMWFFRIQQHPKPSDFGFQWHCFKFHGSNLVAATTPLQKTFIFWGSPWKTP